MSNSVVISVDTTPPGNPALFINGGALSTASLDATVHLSSADYLTGAADVADMIIWGDVDPGNDVHVQPFEDASDWQAFTVNTDVKFINTIGRKRMFARLRDTLGNETEAFGSYIDYDPSFPQVSMVVEPMVSAVSTVAGHDEITFSWESNLPFIAYRVRVMPAVVSPYFGGSQIPTVNGSVNIEATGSFPATTPITTTIKGADLVIASPGDTDKIIKVFVQDSAGRWSP